MVRSMLFQRLIHAEVQQSAARVLRSGAVTRNLTLLALFPSLDVSHAR
jgi:hypothetical protein